ncbi:MAG: CHAT domain-containing protein [Ornithinibacter sp.]
MGAMPSTVPELERVSVLDARLPCADAVLCLAGVPERRQVVVLDRDGGMLRAFVLAAGTLQRGLVAIDGATVLRDAIGLETRPPAQLVDVAVPAVDGGPLELGAVVVRGDRVLGIVTAAEGARGAGQLIDRPAGSPPWPAPEWMAGRPTSPPETLDVQAPTAPAPVLPAPPPQVPGGMPGTPSSGVIPVTPGQESDQKGTASGIHSGDDLSRFRAFPRAVAPAQARAGVPITVRVGFAAEPSADDASATPVLVAAAGRALDFEIQVSGFGFTFPEGSRRTLTVERDEPERASEDVTVIAEDVPARFPRCLEVSYSFKGVPVGRAWCDVLVEPAASTAAGGPVIQPVGGRSGTAASGTDPADRGSDLAEEEPGVHGGTGFGEQVPAPDLTVTIRTVPGRPEVSWEFQSPHDVPRPDVPVLKDLGRGTPEAFATTLLARMPAIRGSALLEAEVRGVASHVARAMPPEFWDVLGAVWACVGADRTPTLLLVTDEAYVPWELALVDPIRCPPGWGGPGAGPPPLLPLLGVLCSVGRWLVPQRDPGGRDRPVAPPPASLDASTMAVVIGRYTAGVARLKGAVAEGEALVKAYHAVDVGIDETSVLDLIEDRLVRDGAPYHPGVVHLALHGQVSPTTQQFTGLKIGVDGQQYLSPQALLASPLAEAGSFVFLNACQVGVAGYTLGDVGGFAGALLHSGARGMVGPLWNVDDDLAKGLSTTFYAATFGAGESVGEAVRRLRAGFGSTSVPTATPLAYVFYGHPDLRLNRTGGPGAPVAPAKPVAAQAPTTTTEDP